TEITIRSDEGAARKCELRLERGSPDYVTLITVVVTHNGFQLGSGWLRGVKTKYDSHQPAGFLPLDDVPEAHLVEAYPASFQRPLHELYTKVVQHGRRKQALGIISEVFPGVSNVEILTENGEPILHFVFADYSVPATLAGDGIQSLLRLSLEL